MRLTFTNYMRRLLLLFPLFLCTMLFANDNQDGEKITLSEKSVELKIVFKKITSQTGIKFVYSNRLIDDEQKVDVSVRNANLEEVMQQIFVGKKFELQRTSPKSVVIVVHEKVTAAPSLPVVNDIAIIDISGTVSDVAGEKLPGATVMVKGTNKATMTDGEGRFRLMGVLANARLWVSYTGYEGEEIKLVGQREVSVKLRMGENRLDEAVVVAYGNTTQRKSVGAMTVVKGATIENLPNRSFDRSLQGQVPGLLITPGNGQPGGGTSNIVLRGIGTGTDVINGSSIRNPLFIIDGVQITQDHLQTRIATTSTPVSNPLAQINPSDIETITVLKDAAAIALYGSRASNGVILVTTKQGKAGKTRINIRHQTDIASRMRGKVDVLNQKEYLDLLYSSYKNANPGFWTDERIKSDLISKFPTIVRAPGDTVFYETPDWFSELYNNQPVTVSNDITFSGGNDQNVFYLNIEYTSQKGIIKKTGYDRTSIRYNFSSNLSSWLRVGINSMFSYNKQDLQGFFEDGSVASALPYTVSPLLPVRLQNKNYHLLYKFGGSNASSEISNPVASIEYNRNNVEAYRGLGNIYGEMSILKGLKFHSNLGADVIVSNNREKLDPRLTQYSTYQALPAGGYIQERNVTRNIITFTNTLRYERAFEDHGINVILGHEAQIFKERSIMAGGFGLSSSAFENVNSATSKAAETASFKQTLLSYFYQINYTYASKYQLSLSGRTDGSSNFGEKALFNNYWSGGAGWIISSERFMKNTLKWLSYAKVRGSFGIAGSANTIPASARFEILKQANYSGNIPAVRGSNTPSNPYIKPEKTFNQDGGLEARFINDRFGLTLDVYKRKISNLLYSMVLPGASGTQNVISNIGDMVNKGTELSIFADVIRNNKLRWNINANWSTNKNKLVKTTSSLAQISSTANLINKVGENFNSFYLVRWGGVNPEDGTPQWLDSAGKKKSTFSLDDRVISGKPQPDGFGGITNTFSYKNFDFSFFIYYQYGFQIYDNAAAILRNDGGRYPYINQQKDALNQWRRKGDQSLNPLRILNNPNSTPTYARSTRFLYDGDFMRLKNVTLTYNFSPSFVRKIKMSMLRIFVQANNMATWTKFPGIDPETTNLGGEASFPYPQQKNWTVGLNAQL